MDKIFKNPLANMPKVTIATLCMVCMLLSGACQSNMNGNDEVTSLNGTMWKLAGIVDTKAGKLKVLEGQEECEKCFTLMFETDNTFLTYTSANELDGIYGIDNETQSFFMFIRGGTKVMEHPDGLLFRNSINAVRSFFLQKNELRLYYNDNKNYLNFKPLVH